MEAPLVRKRMRRHAPNYAASPIPALPHIIANSHPQLHMDVSNATPAYPVPPPIQKLQVLYPAMVHKMVKLPSPAALSLSLAAIDRSLGVGPYPPSAEVARNALDASDIDAATSFVSQQPPFWVRPAPLPQTQLPSIEEALNEALENARCTTPYALPAEAPIKPYGRARTSATDLYVHPQPKVLPHHAQDSDAVSACSSISVSSGTPMVEESSSASSIKRTARLLRRDTQIVDNTPLESGMSVTIMSGPLRRTRRQSAISKRRRQ